MSANTIVSRIWSRLFITSIENEDKLDLSTKKLCQIIGDKMFTNK